MRGFNSLGELLSYVEEGNTAYAEGKKLYVDSADKSLDVTSYTVETDSGSTYLPMLSCPLDYRAYSKKEVLPSYPVDTVLLVSLHKNAKMVPRHFKKFDGGFVYCFPDGKSSKTAQESASPAAWTYWKNPETGEGNV